MCKNVSCTQDHTPAFYVEAAHMEILLNKVIKNISNSNNYINVQIYLSQCNTRIYLPPEAKYIKTIYCLKSAPVGCIQYQYTPHRVHKL